MKPRTVSATSLETYLGCPKRFAADLAGRVYTAPSGPSSFGTALHAALDKYIEKLYDPETGLPYDESRTHQPELLANCWTAAAGYYLGWGNPYQAEGDTILEHWLATRSLPWRVLSRESKEHFDVEIPGFGGLTQSVTWICDRIDENEDGSITIIDYKSQWEDTTPDKMRDLVQPALYALAIRKKFGVDRVAVEFDMMRYQTVTIIFTGHQMDKFEEFLGTTIARVWNDTDPRETLNKGCKWCVRAGVCKQLARATEVGVIQTMSLEEVADLRERTKNAAKALESILMQTDGMLLEHLRDQPYPTSAFGDLTVTASVTRRTHYSAEAVMGVLGDDAIPFLTVTKGPLDKELKRKGSRFTPAQAAEIWDLGVTTVGEPTIGVARQKVSE